MALDLAITAGDVVSVDVELASPGYPGARPRIGCRLAGGLACGLFGVGLSDTGPLAERISGGSVSQRGASCVRSSPGLIGPSGRNCRPIISELGPVQTGGGSRAEAGPPRDFPLPPGACDRLPQNQQQTKNSERDPPSCFLFVARLMPLRPQKSHKKFLIGLCSTWDISSAHAAQLAKRWSLGSPRIGDFAR